jgi:hypothetical protein
MSIADGRKIAIRFTQPLIGDVLGLNPPAGYKKSLLDLSGAAVTTLNQYSTSYTGAKAIDNNTSTYWRGTTAVNWLKLQLPEAKCVTQIRLYLGSYYIKTFTFSGSNDGSTWTQLGGEYTAASSSTAQWYTFEIDNKVPYLYYRMDTLTTYSSRVYLYELELYEDAPVGNETKFTISFDAYNYVPGGELSRVVREASSIEVVDAHTIVLNFAPGNTNSIQRAVGDIAVAYNGSGTLMGQGGPVLAFEHTFTPEGLDPKNDPNNVEHVEVTSIDLYADFITVYYRDFQNAHEHIAITSIEFECALIHVDDI